MFSDNNTVNNIHSKEERGSNSLSSCKESFAAQNSGNTIHSLTVSESYDGHRLDYVVSRELGISRGFSQKLIKSGQVSLSAQKRVKPSLKTVFGDEIVINVPPLEPLNLEPEDIDFEVVYSDSDVIVINKPAGLVVHPSPGHWSGTLVHGLLYKFPELGNLNGVMRPGIVHRLDATTSGLMVVARNGLAQEGLFRDFKARRVYKEYLAMCNGVPQQPKGEIHYSIGRDPYNKLRMAALSDGREAWTDYEVLWSCNGQSLVKCLLHSGRTHQIRVHMKMINCPLVGDKLYNPSRQCPFENERVFLHSWKLSFSHPRSGVLMNFRATLPKELISYIQKIRSL